MSFIYTLIYAAFIAFNPITETNTCSIEGKVIDVNTNESLIFCAVTLHQDNKLISGTETDVDGIFFFSNLMPGTYDIEVQYVGYLTQKQSKIIVEAGKTHKVEFKMKNDDNILQEVQIMNYTVPLAEINNAIQGSRIRAKKIRSLPSKSVNAIKATSAGISKDNGDISIRGSRSNEIVYFIDGVKVIGQTNSESYAPISEPVFQNSNSNALSTFALDVDKAAYSNVRRFINNGQLPPSDAVRIEEMINYFEYNYSPPQDVNPIAVTTTYTECPWNSEVKLLHIGVQSPQIENTTLPASNFVFLIDVSGSMDSENKLPLVISSFKAMLSAMKGSDKVAIVTYAGNASIALPSTPASEKGLITTALESLRSGGSTAGAQGILTAYDIASKNFIVGGNNRVVLATDGDFNVGVNDPKGLQKLIEAEREKGIYLSVLGYGMGNYKDDTLELLADKGNGNYAYIDNMQEALKVLVKEFCGSMYTIAKDVKFQVEFNPEHVKHYRLVGYENRMLTAEEFNDDKKDGGELGLGHQMTAVYEILTIDSIVSSNIDALKYQTKSELKTEHFNELATIKFRYKSPEGGKSKKMDQVVINEFEKLEETNPDIKFSISVAHASMIMRNISTVNSKNMSNVISLAKSSLSNDKDGYRSEFVRLMESYSQLTGQVANGE